MAESIVLDAGHGGVDNGAVFEDMVEKEDNLRIVLALGQELENRGIRVFYTRTTDVYQTPYEKAELANETGADVFLSIHRNSSPNPGEYAGVESLVYKKEGLANELAENIVGALGLMGFEEIGVSERPEIIVLRKTRMPAVLAEIGFINQPEDNRLVEEEFSQVITALADAVQGTLQPQMRASSADGFYRVEIARVRDRDAAAKEIQKTASQGFPASLEPTEKGYRVCVGRYRELDNAALMERVLKERGYITRILG